MMYSQRGMATDAGDDCGSVFGGDPERCDDVQEIVQKIFASPAPSAAEARDLCRQAGIDDLAVARSDPAWQDAGGWVWTLPLVTSPAEGSSFRIVHCGDVSPRLP